MSTQKSKKVAGGRGGGTPYQATSDYLVTFVSVYLTDDDRAVLRSWEYKNGDLEAFIFRHIESGYKVSCSRDDKHDSYILALTGSRSCSEESNIARCLTSRGVSMEKALLAMIYKLEYYCPGGVFPLSSNTRSDSDFG